MRIRRVELKEAASCAICPGARALGAQVVAITQKAPCNGEVVTWYLCIPCARRIGVAAMGGRWGSR